MYTLNELQQMSRVQLRRTGVEAGLTHQQVARMTAATVIKAVLKQRGKQQNDWRVLDAHGPVRLPDYTAKETEEAGILLAGLSPPELRNVKYVIERADCKVQWAVEFVKLREQLKKTSESLSLTADEGTPTAYLWIRTISTNDLAIFGVLADLLHEKMPTALQPPPDVLHGIRLEPIHHAILNVIDRRASVDAPSLIGGVERELGKAVGDRTVYYHTNRLVEGGLIKKSKVAGRVHYHSVEKEEGEDVG